MTNTIAPGDLAAVAVVGVKAFHTMIEDRDAMIGARKAKLAERGEEIVVLKQHLVVLEAGNAG